MTTVKLLDNEKLVAEIYGEIDHHTAREIREIIDSKIERTSPKQLALDFGGVGFMDSSGIGLIIGRYKLMQSIGGEIIIENASERIKKILTLSGISRLAEIKE